MPIDGDREHRITYEVVVDCYNGYEVSMGWYYYLEDRLNFPFESAWLGTGHSKPEIVEAISMAGEEECKTDMLIEIRYRDGEDEDVFTVPLSDLQPTDEGASRMEAIEDWRYWLDQGNRLIDPNECEEY
ncbi:MAG: calcium-binding protein [Phormidesmis sp.]